jgi:hypothetical protein
MALNLNLLLFQPIKGQTGEQEKNPADLALETRKENMT